MLNYQSHPIIKISQPQLRGYLKTSKQAQSGAFLCLLVYFTVKIFTILIFYNWKNILKDSQSILAIIWFIILLVINTYYMLTAGINPGYQLKRITQENDKDKLQSLFNQQQQQQKIINLQLEQNDHEILNQQASLFFTINHNQSLQQKDALILNQKIPSASTSSENTKQSYNYSLVLQKYCKICNSIKRNRMKHCYSCGKCIMKQDHHCPWIGSCVGQKNHFKFVMCLLAHTLQSVTSFYICISSLQFYQYHDNINDSFSTKFGVFLIWSIFMFLYICFAGGLLLFHCYLISTNQTTRELMSRRKCLYLKNVKGNPFDKGIVQNISQAIWPNPQGNDWTVRQDNYQKNKQDKSYFSKIFNNQYYSCC